MSQKKLGHFFTAYNFRNIEQIFTKFTSTISKVDLIKLWHDVQNEETLISAKFGKDLFNISKVIGCKKVAQFDSQCRVFYYTVLKAVTIL